ncbi:hypothetical protein [Streptomyces sp. NPDC093097]|uniref:hypothetical protein n=1 Tax=Streptomyces sp. NPDC093097 TaxID=3366027 RepID=UPI00382B7E06
MTTTVVKVLLAPRERQVVEGLAEGHTLAMVAGRLGIQKGTAYGYLKVAKRKLHGVREAAAAVAVGYATTAIPQPQLLNPETLQLPPEQSDLVPLVARELTIPEMAVELKRPLTVIRRDSRNLLVSLRARNRPHAMKRAWQFQILTAEQVTAWLR